MSKHPKAQIVLWCYLQKKKKKLLWIQSEKALMLSSVVKQIGLQEKSGTAFSCDVPFKWPLNRNVNSEDLKRKMGILLFPAQRCWVLLGAY